MIGFAVALCAGVFLYFRFSSKKPDEMERLFAEELRRIKNDSVRNFVDQNLGRENFELFGDVRFAVAASAANDEGCVSYPITSLQDLDPQDLA